MSRMSALTTLRLIGSPTNPGCPYWRPCSDCLSLPREKPTGGVGAGAAGPAGPQGVFVAMFWAAPEATVFEFWGAARMLVLEMQTSNRTSVVHMADLTRG